MAQVLLPESATRNGINTVGLLFMLTSFIICKYFSIAFLNAVIILILSYAVPIILLEKHYLHGPQMVNHDGSFKVNWDRVITKLVALFITLLIVSFIYWVLPEYHKKLYLPVWRFLKYISPAIIVLSIPYFIYMDTKDKDPYDGYWVIGKILTFSFYELKEVKNKRRIISQYILAWMVKGFFIPNMFVMMGYNVGAIYNIDPLDLIRNVDTWAHSMVRILFGIDLFIALAGYIFAFKLFDSHIRSTENTFFGWFVCIICYYPFYQFFFSLLIKPEIGTHWTDNPYLQFIWIIIGLTLLTIYVLATIVFGIRFSNLTHRGIITGGLYRYIKHPAYLSKNALWWFTTLPFIIAEPSLKAKAISLSLLSLTSLIYYFRAKTEEAHLSRDQTYVTYCAWIEHNGLFAKLKRRLKKNTKSVDISLV